MQLTLARKPSSVERIRFSGSLQSTAKSRTQAPWNPASTSLGAFFGNTLLFLGQLYAVLEASAQKRHAG